MSAIRRRFLDWSKPALPEAARWLLRNASDGRGDLSQTIVVLPGSRAGRRLLELLVDEAEQGDFALSPPQIITEGALPELLYPPQRPFADDLTQRLAWVEALRTFPRARLQTIIPDLPSADDIPRWLELADILRRQHIELAADGLDFSRMVQQTEAVGQASESRRWSILREVQEKYLGTLDNLQLWDKQTARLVAIQHRECSIDKDQQIVLLATVDMNQAARQMLDQLAGQVTALIVAPEELADHFDAHGCLIPQLWSEIKISVRDEQLVLADDAVDQAYEVAAALASFDGKYRSDQITIGVCDEQIVPQIERQLEQCNVPVRFGPGQPIAQSSPFRLLRAIADYLEHGKVADLAALLRHPDLGDWLSSQECQGDWITELDEYHNRHFQARIDGTQWLGRLDETEHLQKACACLHELLKELPQKTAALNSWSAPLVKLLVAIYGDARLSEEQTSERTTLRAIQQIHDALLQQQMVPLALMPAKMSAAEAMRWALAKVSDVLVSPPAKPGAVEIIGWLELALDDAPGLVVTSLNDGLVPKCVNSDLFLPDQLRRDLGLLDNARRYARDAYALRVLLASRPETRLIVGRRNADGDPLPPSRLLFACDDETLVRRVEILFRAPPSRATKRPLAGGLIATREMHGFEIPRPTPPAQPIEELSATQFRSYLACPYRFYLGHVLHLNAIDDEADELDGGSFGSLAHRVLGRFGRDPRHATTDVEEIEHILDGYLGTCAKEIYGSFSRAAVEIQIEQLRQRLHAFAAAQARWAEEGWRIFYAEDETEVEYDVAKTKRKRPANEQTCELDVDGKPFRVKGRIDRIDRHVETGAWAVFDYKSSDSATKPEAAHFSRSRGWLDLQLPLYRRLAAGVTRSSDVKLGYIVLPKDTSQVKFLLAEWDAPMLAQAEEIACNIIRALRAQQFGPPTEPPPVFSELFASICLDDVFDRPSLEDWPPGMPVATFTEADR